MGDFDWYGTCAAVQGVRTAPCFCAPAAARAPGLPPSRASPHTRTLTGTQTGACTDVMAGDVQGNFLGSYPLQEDGNYKFFLYTDPYKATISKSTGEDVEEDVYEAYYLGLLLQGKRAEIPDGHVIRVGGEKYMHLRVRAAHVRLLEMERALAAALTLYTPHPTPCSHPILFQVLGSETYIAKIKDADGNETAHNVTIPEVHVMKKGNVQLFMGNKGGYFFIVKSVSKGMGDSGADALAAMAIGFYWACGADA